MRYYRTAISNGIFLLPLIALLPLIPYYIKHRKRGIANPFRLLSFYAFILYVLISWYFVVLPLPSEEWLATIKPAGVNLIPFSYFRDLSVVTGFDVMESDTYFSAIGSNFALQYWFNILMLVPLGMFLRYLFRMNWKRTALISLFTTVLFEITQLTGVFFLFSKPYRSFDVDDIICNFLGGILGYWLMGLLMPLVQKIETKAASAFRKGTRLSLFRRASAYFIDLNIVYGLDRLVRVLTGDNPLIYDLTSITGLLVKLFIYTLLSSLFLKGATVGKWLLHFRVCNTDGTSAPFWRIFLRYAILYNAILLLVVIPHFSLVLPEGGEQVIKQLSRLFCTACLVYYMVVGWMFPTGDLPWGTISGTRLEFSDRAHVQQHS